MSKFQKVCLVRVTHSESSSERVYENFPLVIGRSTEASVGIIDPGVSRSHLEVQFKNGKLSLKDLGSANGTFMNGVKLEPQAIVPYNPGDKIELGTNKIPVVIDVFEKAFDARLIAKSDLTAEQKKQATNMLDAAHAEVQRLSWLFKGQQEQAEKANEEKVRVILKDAQAKAADILKKAEEDADKVKASGQKAHDEVVGASESDAKKKAESIINDAKVQAEVKAKMLRETAEHEAREISARAKSDFEKMMEEGRAELKKHLEEKEKELQEAADKKAEAQLRLAVMQGEDQVKEMREKAEIEIRAMKDETREEAARIKAEAEILKEEAAKLHREVSTVYQAEVDRAEKTVAEMRRVAEEETAARAEQSQVLLKNAVEKSQKMLTEAETISTEQLKSAEIKSEAMMKVAREESAALIEKTQKDILGQFEKSQEDAKKLRLDTENELRDSFASLLATKTELEEKSLKLKSLNEELQNKGAKLIETEKSLSDKEQMATALSENFRIAEAQLKAAEGKRDELVREATEAQKKRAEFLADMKSKQSEWEKTRARIETEANDLKMSVKAEIEDYRSRAQAEIDKMKLEELEQLKEIRLEGDRGLDRHRSEIVKELLKSAELHFHSRLKASLPEDFNWASVSEPLHNEVKNQLEQVVYELSTREAAKEEAAGLLKNQMKFKEKARKYTKWAAAAIAGLLILPWTREPIMAYFTDHSMHTAADKFTKDMQAERERRYNPEKSRVWKSSYTELVLFTEGYVNMKLDSTTQEKWIKDLHNYLYGKLRVDEDSIVKIVSTEAALVASLKEQADQIHPDYVKEKTELMKATEAESVGEMKKLVGSEAKWEKFQKYSQDFYYNEYLMRLPAQAPSESAPAETSAEDIPTGE